MTEIYKVQLEVNDQGWNKGNVCFVHADDAVKHMRKFIAQQIMDARREGSKVQYFCTFKDTALWSRKDVPPQTQTISFRITTKHDESSLFEYRVCAEQLYDNGEYWKNEKPFYHWL